MDENVQNTETLETAISEEPEKQEEEAVEETVESTPAEAEEPTEESTQVEVPSFELKVRYNREDKVLSEDEARDWAQKGMKYTSLYDKLDYIATQNDLTVNQLVDNIITSIDDAKRDELIDRYGEDDPNIEKLMEQFHNEQKVKYEKATADRRLADEQKVADRNAEIASEFTQMQADFPELKEISDIPKSVMKLAAEGMPLPYAYLLHTHKEGQKVEAAKKQEQIAAESSPGSVAADAENQYSNDEQAFLSAFWGN